MMRSSGILMHLSSLPSPHGIGTLGEEAFRFVDFLSHAGVRYWQMLPIGPTGYGDSPYQSVSSYAGNPYLIDLPTLEREGLLEGWEYQNEDWGCEAQRVDYQKLYAARRKVLFCAFSRGWTREAAALEAFCASHRWVEDYALFMACKEHFDMRPWYEWEDAALRRREPQALEAYREKLTEPVAFWSFVQMLFYRQWAALRAYAAGRDVKLIGDVPIYTAYDSADVWAQPEAFWLDESLAPVCVAGCPPDYFSQDGQLWGNPLYRWDRMEQDGYRWWLDRLRGLASLFDVVRIDHFRGFEAYYCIPYGDTNARGGYWKQGPGMALIEAIRRELPELSIIAEDLGLLTDGVRALLRESGFPGMKVLQFAFDSDNANDYLPHQYPRNCVVYTGTHDNDTSRGWYEQAGEGVQRFCREYLGFSQEEPEPAWRLIRAAWGSVADLAVAPMQDFLNLREGRMNTPSTQGDNWCWRVWPGAFDNELAGRIARLNYLYRR